MISFGRPELTKMDLLAREWTKMVHLGLANVEIWLGTPSPKTIAKKLFTSAKVFDQISKVCPFRFLWFHLRCEGVAAQKGGPHRASLGPGKI